MRGAGSPAVPLVVAAVLLMSTATALPRPGENDAGSGGDAPDYLSLPPVWVGEGTFQGNVTGGNLDPRDIYRFEAPPASVTWLTAQVEAAEEGARLELTFSGPAGQVTVVTGDDGTVRWKKATPTGTPTNLTVGVFSRPFGNDSELGYTISLEFESYDDYMPLDGGEDRATAWRVAVPEGTFGAFEFLHSFNEYRREPGPHYQLRYLDLPRSARFPCSWLMALTNVDNPWPLRSTLTGYTGFGDEPGVWTTGFAGDLEVPPSGGPDWPLTGDLFFPLGAGGGLLRLPDGNLTARVGAADSDGVGLTGWVLWNDPGKARVERLPALGDFARASDFRADQGGFGVGVGPVAYAEDVSYRFDMPAETKWTNFVYADGTTPRLASGDPLATALEHVRLDMLRPGRAPVELRDEWRLWFPWEVLDGVDTDISSGPWRAQLRHVDGFEAHHIRLVRASFGFPPLTDICDGVE